MRLPKDIPAVSLSFALSAFLIQNIAGVPIVYSANLPSAATPPGRFLLPASLD